MWLVYTRFGRGRSTSPKQGPDRHRLHPSTTLGARVRVNPRESRLSVGSARSKGVSPSSGWRRPRLLDVGCSWTDSTRPLRRLGGAAWTDRLLPGAGGRPGGDDPVGTLPSPIGFDRLPGEMACGWEDSTPFLVVAGAGHSPVDGRYAQDGFREGKPKFKKVGGEFIIFFRWGMWKLGAEEDTTVWLYESSTGGPGSPTTPTNSGGASSMPPSAWVAAQAKHGPAPSVSLGTCRDLQEGDVVTIVKHHEEVDWGAGGSRRNTEKESTCATEGYEPNPRNEAVVSKSFNPPGEVT